MKFKAKPKYKTDTRENSSDLSSVPAEVISDEDLWRAFQKGEDAAFNMLYGRYGDRLYAYLKLLLAGSHEHIDDLFQDVWIHLFKTRDRFKVKGKGSVAGWLFKLAHNMAISLIRKKPFAFSLEDLHVDTELIEGFVTPATQDQFEGPTAEDLMGRVVQSVEKLPLLLREVFVLSEFNGLSLDEIARTLGITTQNAKVRLFRARRHLREDLTRVFDISEIGNAL